MNKNELIESLEDGRAEVIEMLEELPDETMLASGAMGDWSIKDILAHLVQWEGQLVTLLFQARQGMKKPTTAHFDPAPRDEINQRWMITSRERPLDIIWKDFTGIRKQTVRRVSEFTEKELNDPNLYPWLNGTPLWQWIVNDTIEHETEHGDQIFDWLEQNDAGNDKKNGHVRS